MGRAVEYDLPVPAIRRIDADGVHVFYRSAGDPMAPVVLLLHGFPSSSFMFRELIPRLATRYRVIAPDLPGFGFTEVPAGRHYAYSFGGLALTIDAFTQALDIDRYALYVFDYGAPTGFRLAMAHPERITAIVSQNGNAYEGGWPTPGIPSDNIGQRPRENTARSGTPFSPWMGRDGSTRTGSPTPRASHRNRTHSTRRSLSVPATKRSRWICFWITRRT